jgi:aminoglycoside phosphotransferase family enzyme/predicted kinase
MRVGPYRWSPAPGASAELRETHISWVVLEGDRAYKIKKPVVLPFLDYGSIERRHELCREEVRLNRRLAPEVYLGVGTLVPDSGGVRPAPEDAPGAVEYVVVMRRYDERRTLARELDARSAGEGDVRAVGARLAAFHAAAARPRDAGGSVAALERMLAENVETLRELDADRAVVDDAGRLLDAVLAARRDELLARAHSGLVRDGHGDLRAEHVVLERGIEIVDCVEFDPELREIDVGLDLAFLAMDLLRHDRRLAAALVAAYREAGGDPGDDALVAFFAAQRALIRAKVALVRAGQVTGADAARRRTHATTLLALAGRLGWQLRLGPGAVVCGLAASGKSTLAASLAERAGATVISSDPVRKELLGIAASERAPEDAYGPEMNRRTYEALGRLARERVGPVVVDATFRRRQDRDAFGRGYGRRDDLVWIECRAPDDVRARRAAVRTLDPLRVSDADAAVAVRQAGNWDPLDRLHLTVSTDRAPEAVMAEVRDGIDRRLRGELRTR